MAWALELGRQPSFLLFTNAFMIVYNLIPLWWVVRLEPVEGAALRKAPVSPRASARASS